MIYFKHMTNAMRDERITALFQTHRHQGVLTYLWLLELIGESMDETDRCHLEHHPQQWAKLFRTYAKDLEKILRRCAELQLIIFECSPDHWKIFCPKLLKLRGPFGKRRVQKSPHIYNKNKNNNITPISPIGEFTYPESFEKIWEDYPKKIGKGAAFKAWNKPWIRDDANQPILRKALAEQKSSAAWQKENGAFIPNLATWLNQRRWEDEIAITKKRGVFVSTKPDIPGMVRLAEQKKLQLGLSDEEK